MIDQRSIVLGLNDQKERVVTEKSQVNRVRKNENALVG